MADSALPARGRWHTATAGLVRIFNAYGRWLAGIGWLKFAGLAVLLLVTAGILQNVPPFTWRVAEYRVEAPAPRVPDGPRIVLDDHGVRVDRGPVPPGASAPPAASARPQVDIRLPPGVTSEAVREAVAEAREALREAIAEAQAELEEAPTRERVVTVRLGDSLPQLAVVWILLSAILKIVYAGRVRAEVTAAAATETAEAEALRRQVSEARLAALQAQVEPHFLFNTLASIDHLIETDPPRASAMQKHLIALLRARLPALRGAEGGGLRPLGEEMAVVEPYLALLKMRMEERLRAHVEVPEGLRSARFPPMVLQGLVENAIRHGLEPKAEGGELRIRAEVAHGRLVVSVADTGLGFGRAATSGTGMGLAGMRERLALLYGDQATLTVAEQSPSGTVVAVAVPYVADKGERA